MSTDVPRWGGLAFACDPGALGDGRIELLVVEAELFALAADDQLGLATWWEVEPAGETGSGLAFTFSVRIRSIATRLPLELYAVFALDYPGGPATGLSDAQLAEFEHDVVVRDGLAAADELLDTLRAPRRAPSTGPGPLTADDGACTWLPSASRASFTGPAASAG